MSEINNWKSYFEEIYGIDYSFKTYKFNFHFLYRGRPFKQKDLIEIQKELENTKRIWSPPKSKCSKQRCSNKGDRKLYLSSHISSIPLELESKEGDLIAIVKYKQLDFFQPLTIVGLDDLKRIPVDGDFIKTINDHHKGKDEKIIRIDSILSNIFKTRKKNNGIDIYDVTIALTNLYFRKSIGLIYPSVAAGYKSFNIVLKQQKVKHILKPLEIGIYKVNNINSNKSADFKKLSNGTIFENGIIKWNKETDNKVYRYKK